MLPGAGCLFYRETPGLEFLLTYNTRGRKFEQALISDLGGARENSDPDLLFCAARESSEESFGGCSDLDPDTSSLLARILNANQALYWFMRHHSEAIPACQHPSQLYVSYLVHASSIDVDALNSLSIRHSSGKRIFVWVTADQLLQALSTACTIALPGTHPLRLHPRIAESNLQAVIQALSARPEFRPNYLASLASGPAGSLPERQFAVIDCEDDPAWRGHEHLWYLHLQSFEKSSPVRETWRVFRAYRGELPPNDGRDFAGLVVTGSHHSVNDASQAWIHALCAFIRACTATGQTRLFASCFGCQCTAAALGGQVGKNPSGEYVFQTENVVLREEAAQDSFPPEHPVTLLAKATSAKAHLTVLQSHGECVARAPTGSRVICSSPSTLVEAFVWGSDARGLPVVFAIQSHPEFSQGMMTQLILPSLLAEGCKLSVPVANHCLLRNVRQAEDGHALIGVIRVFLKS